jgi:hypothetical protein
LDKIGLQLTPIKQILTNFTISPNQLLIKSLKLKPLVNAITDLGYQVVSGAEKYQFVKPGPGGSDAGNVKKEWEYTLKLRDQNKNDPFAIEAGDLVAEYFSTPRRLGMIRLMESPYYRPQFKNEEFISILQEMFPQ